MNTNGACIWTAWGEVVCKPASASASKQQRLMEGFDPGAACTVDGDCSLTSRCDKLNVDANMWKCVPCSDIGCVVGKSCSASSECATGLSCQASTCTSGSIITNLNNSDFRTTPDGTDTVARSYEVQRQSNMMLDSSLDSNLGDCATQGSCLQGEPCDKDSLTRQCSSGLVCDAGVCKMSYGTL